MVKTHNVGSFTECSRNTPSSQITLGKYDLVAAFQVVNRVDLSETMQVSR